MNLVAPSESSSLPRTGLFSDYRLDAAYDEMFGQNRAARPHCQPLFDDLRGVTRAELSERQVEADRAFLTQGITFTVYGDDQGTERIVPFDLLPRGSARYVEAGDGGNVRAVRIQPQDDTRRFTDRRGAAGTPRRLSGLRPRDDHAGPPSWGCRAGT